LTACSCNASAGYSTHMCTRKTCSSRVQHHCHFQAALSCMQGRVIARTRHLQGRPRPLQTTAHIADQSSSEQLQARAISSLREGACIRPCASRCRHTLPH
jgi:hypothetical protein